MLIDDLLEDDTPQTRKRYTYKNPELVKVLSKEQPKLNYDYEIDRIIKNINIHVEIDEFNFIEILEEYEDIIDGTNRNTLKKILKKIERLKTAVQGRQLDFVNKLENIIQEILENNEDIKSRKKDNDRFPFLGKEMRENPENIIEKQKEHFPKMYEILKKFREDFYTQYIENKKINSKIIRQKFLEEFKIKVIDPISQIDGIGPIYIENLRGIGRSDIRNKFKEIHILISKATVKQISLGISKNFFFAEVDELIKYLGKHK